MFWHLSVINVLRGNTQLNIYNDHQDLKNVKARALYIWNQRLFMPMSDVLVGQTFSGFQEHLFKAATVQKTLLYSVFNLRIKLAVNFPSLDQAMLRLLSCMFFFLRLGTFGFFLSSTA